VVDGAQHPKHDPTDHQAEQCAPEHLDDEQKADARKALRELALSRRAPGTTDADEVGEIAQGLRLP